MPLKWHLQSILSTLVFNPSTREVFSNCSEELFAVYKLPSNQILMLLLMSLLCSQINKEFSLFSLHLSLSSPSHSLLIPLLIPPKKAKPKQNYPNILFSISPPVFNTGHCPLFYLIDSFFPLDSSLDLPSFGKSYICPPSPLPSSPALVQGGALMSSHCPDSARSYICVHQQTVN